MQYNKYKINDKFKFINQINDQKLTEFIVEINGINIYKNINQQIVVEYIFIDFPETSITLESKSVIYTRNPKYIEESVLTKNNNIIYLEKS